MASFHVRSLLGKRTSILYATTSCPGRSHRPKRSEDIGSMIVVWQRRFQRGTLVQVHEVSWALLAGDDFVLRHDDGAL